MNATRLPPLDCPFCGVRPLGEFVFRKTLPNVDGDVFAEVYLRHDSDTQSLEEWQHLGGCRAWLQVRRNPATGEIHEVSLK